MEKEDNKAVNIDERDRLIKEFDLKIYIDKVEYGNRNITYILGSHYVEFSSEEHCLAFELPFYIYIYQNSIESHKTKEYSIARAILKAIKRTVK